MPFSNTYANNILNWAFGKTGALAVHNAVYIGLCSNDPEADNGAFTELSGDTYERVLIAQYNETYPNFISSATGREIKNQYQINWTKATVAWEKINGFGLFTVKQGDSPYFYGKLELTAEQEAAGGLEVPAGAVALFDPQTLKISFPSTDVTATAASE